MSKNTPAGKSLTDRPPLRFYPARIEPVCCRLAGLVVYWAEEPSTSGPGERGWTMAYDMTHAVNVKYCPFCGQKLPEEPVTE